MEKNTFFTPGPAALYPHLEEYLQQAMDLQLGSISHRSAQFKKVYQHTDEQLRALLGIPAEHAIMFTGTASEIWERIILNLSSLETFHLVNGSFSKKFYEYAVDLGRHAHKQEKPMKEGFQYAEVEVPAYAEVICTTQNETSTGVQMREPDIHKLKRSHAGKLLAVDMVSSAPIADLDYGVVDTAFFSVQKSFGLPAGLGVWIANEACLAKSEELASQGSIGAHHRLPELWKQSKAYQTPSTPNVLGIYMLGKVAEDMNKTGIDTLRKVTEQKAKRLYDYFEAKPGYGLAVKEAALRSKTVCVVEVEQPAAEVISALKSKGLVIGAGYGPFKETQLRIANFIATSPEKIEDLLSAFDNL